MSDSTQTAAMQSSSVREGQSQQPAFVTTHWSVVLSAQDGDSPQSAEALAKLCSAYWFPLYRSVVTNEPSWSSAFALAMIKGEARRFAEQSVIEKPAPTEKEIADADAALKWHRTSAESANFIKQPWFPLMLITVALAIYVGIPALIAAGLFRGGLVLLITGVTFVRRDGARASRLRVLWRGLVAWSPMLLMLVLFGLLKAWLGTFNAALGAALVAFGLAVLSVVLPKRGLADRLAGTWPVPRRTKSDL